MYDNISSKIKGLAKATFIIEAIGAIIAGIVLIASDEYLVLFGLLVMICGPLIAWVSSWLLYGYGQLIENSDIICEEYNRKNKTNQKHVAKNNEKKQDKPRKELNAIITNSDITDDEYVDYYCPKCKEELSFTKEQLQNPDGLTCPMCDTPISL